MANVRKGKIMKLGDELVSTYPARADMTKYLIYDYYKDQVARIGKADGFTHYGTSGVFNPIYGKELTAGMFASNNIFTAIGARPYDHEGVRISYKLAQKGGIGATTVQDGMIPPSKMMPVKQIRQPYKELTFSFDYGLGLKALQAYDDTVDYEQYVDQMSATFADGIDTDLLRPTAVEQPTYEGVETTVNGISRVFGASNEVGQTYEDPQGKPVEITAGMVSPWGGVASDIYEYRDSDNINPFDGYVDNTAGTLTLADMNRLYANCAPYWADQANPNNKMIGMSIVALEKLGALMESQNIWRESVFVQRDFGGVKTIPGRDGGGILMNSYRNIPIIVDGNYNYDPVTERIGMGLGEIHELDLDHVFFALLTPIDFRSTDDFAITRQLREMMVMAMRGEVRANKFLGSGKITNKVA